MINSTKRMKPRYIDVKTFKIKSQDLEEYGITIPSNLKEFKTFSLKQFVLTDNGKFRYVRLMDNKKGRYVQLGLGDKMLHWDKWAKYMVAFLSDEERKNGLTLAELEEKNKQYLRSQLKKLSKKVWYQRESPLAKVFQGETVDIPDSMHIQRSSICLKTIKTTVEELKNSGIKVPFGLEGKLIIDEIALTAPNEKYFFLLREPEFIRKEKTHSWHSQLKLDTYEAHKFFKLFGEDIKKGATFKTLKDTNKKYIENQLQKMAELER